MSDMKGAPSSSTSTMDDVFQLLSLANRLEGESRIEAATKYYEAVYLMKRYLQRIPVSAGQLDTRELIQDKIRHYEKVAYSLMADDSSTINYRQKTYSGFYDNNANSVYKNRSPMDPIDESASYFQAATSTRSQLQANRTPPASSHHEDSQPRDPPPSSSPSGNNRTKPSGPIPGDITNTMSLANSQLAHALDMDEAGHTVLAREAYMTAAEGYLESWRMAQQSKHPSSLQDVSGLLKKRLEQTLDRIQQLKERQQSGTKNNLVRVLETEPRLGDRKRDMDTITTPSTSPTSSSSTTSLTADEINILKRSSLIASGLFLPWSEEDANALSAQTMTLLSKFDSNNTVPPQLLFTDPAGMLALSPKQTSRFHRWARPSEIVRIRQETNLTRQQQSIRMVQAITPYTIKQQYVTDCSFIASLCICAALQRRSGKQLISAILYPQQVTEDGTIQLLYNPAGKYMVKLWLNGVARSVVIDDYLPIDKYGNLLCSHTTPIGKNNLVLELYVSLIEKAYMKLCGGYDFPGSNSGVDLFSLTGWIPERIMFAKDDTNIRDFETAPERAWERILSASSFGDCLITTSTTPDMDDPLADQIGLVKSHAYAVLSVMSTTDKDGKEVRLLQLKNPWAQKGWKGQYSCHDRESWRDSTFCKKVGYDATLAAQQDDDGVFWISWADVLTYFHNIHLSWNPSLFRYRTTTHGFWSKEVGPYDDTFNCGENPQYVLSMSDEAVKNKATFWVLISRHVTKQEQEGAEATDYLTVHVHRNDYDKGRIWYSGRGGDCILTGAYTNNPHVLMRADLDSFNDKYLSLVLSQFQKSNDLAYTLSVYSTAPFSLGKPQAELPHELELSSEWSEKLSGGPIGEKSYFNNPMFAVEVPKDGAEVQFRLSTAKTTAVNLMMVPVRRFGTKPDKKTTAEPVIDSGKYRHGFLVTNRKQLAAGTYTLIASTFHVGETAALQLKVLSSTDKLKFEKIR